MKHARASRRLPVLMALLIIAMAAPQPITLARAAESYTPYKSAGTGGTQPRWRDDPDTRVIVAVQENQDGTLTIEAPSSPALEQAVDQWQTEARAQLQSAAVALGAAPAIQERAQLRDSLLYLDYSLESEAAVRTALFDLRAGKQLALSDLFIDGFDYIAYINGLVASRIEAGEPVSGSQTAGGRPVRLKEPFEGFSADYPFFDLILFDTDGVCFKLLVWEDAAPGRTRQEILIPLHHGISPWAYCYVEATYTFFAFKFGATRSEHHIRVDGRDSITYPDDQALYKLDVNLWKTYTELIGAHHPYLFFGEYPAVPDSCFWDHYYSLRFLPDPGESAPPELRDSIGDSIFNLHSGERIDPAPLAVRMVAQPGTRYYTARSVEDRLVWESAPAGFALPADAHATGASVVGGCVIVTLRDDRGGTVRMIAPLVSTEVFD